MRYFRKGIEFGGVFGGFGALEEDAVLERGFERISYRSCQHKCGMAMKLCAIGDRSRREVALLEEEFAAGVFGGWWVDCNIASGLATK